MQDGGCTQCRMGGCTFYRLEMYTVQAGEYNLCKLGRGNSRETVQVTRWVPVGMYMRREEYM